MNDQGGQTKVKVLAECKVVSVLFLLLTLNID